MRGSYVTTDTQVSELSEQEAADVFDGICRRELNISGREFLDRWDVGDYRDVDVDDVDGLSDVISAISLVR
jgi:hypothetical protein